MSEQGNLFAELQQVEGGAVSDQGGAGKKAGKPGLKQRKKANRKVEDFYALLNVAEDATAADIKRGYLQKTRQFSPESHPFEFERIRKAYDTLRDDALRKEYDIVRQYGESIEDLLLEAVGKRGITAQSIKLLERAITIDPFHTKARLALAYAHICRGETVAFERHFHELGRQAGPAMQLSVMQSKIEQLLQVHRVQAAFDELQKVKETQPDAIKKIWPVFVAVYGASFQEELLLAEIEAVIKAMVAPKPADAEMYAVWLHIVDAFDEDEKNTDRVLSVAKKWLKNFNIAADLVWISKIFIDEYEKCREKKDYYGAKMFVDLALMADRKNTVLPQYAQEVHTVVQIMREVDRLFEDKRLFPGIIIEALRWISEEFDILQEEFDEVQCFLPEEVQAALSDMDEEYAAGIILLKKRYPVIYRYYQRRWEAMFKEKTAGLNRKERRNLRI